MVYVATKKMSAVFFILVCLSKITSLFSVELQVEHRQFSVLTSGYTFQTAYKVHQSTATSPLIVQAYIGRCVPNTRCYALPVRATRFTVVLHAMLNGRSIDSTAYCDAHGHISIEELRKRDARDPSPRLKHYLRL